MLLEKRYKIYMYVLEVFYFYRFDLYIYWIKVIFCMLNGVYFLVKEIKNFLFILLNINIVYI